MLKITKADATLCGCEDALKGVILIRSWGISKQKSYKRSPSVTVTVFFLLVGGKKGTVGNSVFENIPTSPMSWLPQATGLLEEG